MTPALWGGRHMKRMPKTPTKRGTKHGKVGRRPSEAHRAVARQTTVECRCGYRGTLEDVRWWKLMARWIGECPRCHHSPTFTVPLSEVLDQ